MIALVRRHTFISCLQTQALFLLYRWSCSSWPYYWFSWSQEHTHVFQQQFVKLCAHCWLSTMSLLTGQLCTCGTCVDRELHQYQALSHPFVNREACHSSWAFETRCTHPREWDGGGGEHGLSLCLWMVFSNLALGDIFWLQAGTHLADPSHGGQRTPGLPRFCITCCAVYVSTLVLRGRKT